MLSESHSHVKQLILQIKQQESIELELNATFGRASREMQSFKKSFNFRLNLAKSKETLLLKDHFKRFEASNIDLPEEVRILKELLEMRDQEIENLRH